MEKKPLNSSEEIDLLYFVRPVSNAFKKATAWGVRYTRFLAHNRFLFAGILLAGSIAGYCLRFIIPPSYKTEGIFISNMMPAKYCVTLLDNLNELRRPLNIPILAKELNISQDAAWQIRRITPTATLKDTFALEKRDSSMSVFQVTLILHDMRYVDEIGKGLVNYLENNEYVLRRKQARIKNFQAQIDALDAKMQSLDSLRTIVNSSIMPRSQGQGIILGEPINPVSIYQAQTAYLKERLYMQERLSMINHIEVLQPFFKLNEYNNPNYERLLIYAFIASFLFAMMVVPMIGRRPKPRAEQVF